MAYVFYFDVYYRTDNKQDLSRLSTFVIAHSVLKAREELETRLKEYNKEFDINFYKIKYRGGDLL